MTFVRDLAARQRTALRSSRNWIFFGWFALHAIALCPAWVYWGPLFYKKFSFLPTARIDDGWGPGQVLYIIAHIEIVFLSTGAFFVTLSQLGGPVQVFDRYFPHWVTAGLIMTIVTKLLRDEARLRDPDVELDSWFREYTAAFSTVGFLLPLRLLADHLESPWGRFGWAVVPAVNIHYTWTFLVFYLMTYDPEGTSKPDWLEYLG